MRTQNGNLRLSLEERVTTFSLNSNCAKLRVLYSPLQAADTESNGRLETLVSNLQLQIDAIFFDETVETGAKKTKKQKNSFRGHVTLARVTDRMNIKDKQKLLEQLNQSSSQPFHESIFTVNSIALFSSSFTDKSGPPVYEIISEHKFTAAH